MVVFVNTIAEMLLFIATSTISGIWFSLISGEIFKNRGIFVLQSFFSLTREAKRLARQLPGQISSYKSRLAKYKEDIAKYREEKEKYLAAKKAWNM